MSLTRFLRGWRLALALGLVVAGAVSFHVRIGRRMPDFEVYRVAAGRAIAGEPLYRDSDGHWQFKYLPAFALAIAPVSMLPAPSEARTTDARGRGYNPWSDTARVAWFAASVALLVALVALSIRLLPQVSPAVRESGSRGVGASTSGLSDCRTSGLSRGAIVGLTILALGKFYAHELELGQTNVLLAVIVLLAVSAWRSGKELAAGALLGVATVVKPYAIVFLPYLFLRGRRKSPAAASAFVAVLLGALLLPVLRYGFTGNAALLAGWWNTVTGSTPPNLTVADNISVAAMYAKWFGAGPLARWVTLATGAVLVAGCGAMLLIRPKAEFPEYLDAALLLTLIPLLSPQGWDYVLLVATPAVMLLVSHLRALARPARWLALTALLVAGLTIFDLVGRRIYSIFMVSSVVTICYLYTIALLLRLRLMQTA